MNILDIATSALKPDGIKIRCESPGVAKSLQIRFYKFRKKNEEMAGIMSLVASRLPDDDGELVILWLRPAFARIEE